MSSAARSPSQFIPHYTVADYRQWEGDWELWSGIPVAMTPSAFGPHQAAAARLIRLLGNQLEAARCRCHVLPEIDWQISDDTVVRPDVVIVCGDVPAGHLHQTPALIVEILSQSTEQKDRGAKRALYEQQGVAYYLIVDPRHNAVEAYRRGGQGVYHPLPSSAPLSFQLSDDCQISLDPHALFAT